MGTIKITKTLVCGKPLTLAPSWLSNGHWAIRRALLNGQATWDTSAWSAAMDQVCREYDDSSFAELMPHTERAWRMTGMVQMLKDRDAVLFASDDIGSGSETTAMDRAYWNMLGKPETVYAEKTGVPMTGSNNGDGSWLVMPTMVREMTAQRKAVRS